MQHIIYRSGTSMVGITFYTKYNNKWYSYLLGNTFARKVWPSNMDKWEENQYVKDLLVESYIRHEIFCEISKLEFLLATGKGIEQTLREILITCD